MAILGWMPAPSHSAETVALPDGTKIDVGVDCPVCNMKVETATLGPAAVVFKDGKAVGFDGAGDFFRYILAPEKYQFDPNAIKAVYVTEYGKRTFIDAKGALFVVGSDVIGHMGPDVVPFAKKEDAEKFSTEHHGKRVATYGEVTVQDLQGKRKILKMQHGHGNDQKK